MKKVLFIFSVLFLSPVLWAMVFFRHLFGDLYSVVYNRVYAANYEVRAAYRVDKRNYWE